MFHYFEAITNTSGDSLIGYFARVVDPATQNTVTISADDNGTPIVTTSGVENAAVTDAYGNLDFYVVPGTYHLDIYAPNATSLILRVQNVSMNSTKGDPGDPGPQGDPGEGLEEVMAPTGAAIVGFKQNGSGAASRNVLAKSQEIVSSQDFYDSADGADDLPSLRRMIQYLSSAGGGEGLLSKLAYTLSAPLDMQDNVVLRGRMQGTTITYKGSAGSDATGVRCVISAASKKFWGLHNVTLIGDRVKTGGTVTGSNYGVYAEFSGYFEISNVRADYCLEGFKFNQCQTFGITQAVALRCSGYGFRLYNSCTSFRLKGCSPWACGGGFSLTACIYGSIDSPFVENSDNGNLPGGADTDVFGDSGGDAYNPSFMFECIGAQGLTITSPGGENNCSQWLYAEGSQINIHSPHLFNTKTFNGNWRLIQLRGTAKCNVNIVNPFGFGEVIQRVTASGVPVVFVENPTQQKLQITGLWRPATYAAANAISLYGVNDPTSRRLVNLTQSSMIVGAESPFTRTNAGDSTAIIYEGKVKKLDLRGAAGAATRLSIPLNVQEGFFRLDATGTGSGLADNPRLNFAQYNASGDFIGDVKIVSGTGGTFAIGGWFEVAASAGNTLHLDLQVNAGENFKFDQIVLDHIAGQS